MTADRSTTPPDDRPRSPDPSPRADGSPDALAAALLERVGREARGAASAEALAHADAGLDALRADLVAGRRRGLLLGGLGVLLAAAAAFFGARALAAGDPALDRLADEVAALRAVAPDTSLPPDLERTLSRLEATLELVSGGGRDLVRDALAARDAALEELSSTRANVGALERRIAELEDDVARAVSERNRQIGVSSRLQDEVLGLQDRLDQALTAVAVREEDERERERPAIVSGSAKGLAQPIVHDLNDALAGSGADGVKVLEVARIEGGAARDLLVLFDDDPLDPVAAGSARLVGGSGAAALRLDDPFSVGAATTGEIEPFVDVPLPAIDLDAWRRLGMSIADDASRLIEVRGLVEAMLVDHGLALASLGGRDGVELLDVEFVEIDGDGREVRRFVASRAQLEPEGPSLILEEGAVVVDGVATPFYRGVYRLPLPGLDYYDWIAALSR